MRVSPWLRVSAAVVVVAVTTVLGWGATAGSAGVGARAVPPNLVVILSDDQRWDTLARMHNVQRLIARHGVTFRNAFTTTSECCPSRASILTGQYSHHTGVVQNFGPASYPAFDERSNLAVWLHDAGYETALVGKYLNDYTVYGHHRIPPGWSDWVAMDSRPEEKYYDYTLNVNGRLEHHGVKVSDYSTDVLGRKAVAFVRKAKRPFFLYFAPITPHLPATPAPRDLSTPLVLPKPRPNFDERDLSDKPWYRIYQRVFSAQAIAFLHRDIEGRQLRALRDLDRQVGALMRALERKHALRNTVVVFASDNGFLWGEHRLGGKIWPYEESIRVPLVVRVPWQRRATVDDHLVLNIDFASTLAELAGVKPRLRQDGRSFVPFLRGRSPRWRHDFVVEYLGASQLYVGGPPPFQALRSRRWVWIEYENGWRELYDLRSDPYELQNLAGMPGRKPLEVRLTHRLDRLVAR